MTATRGHASRLLIVASLAWAPALALAQDPPAPDPAEGTRRMAARLAELHARRDPRKDPFLTAESVAGFRETLQRGGLSFEDRIQNTVQLANALMTSGTPREATEILAKVVEELKAADRSALPRGLLLSVQELLGMAWLRVGEQENCVLHHGAESCLLPITAGGIHSEPEGSRKAIEVFTEILQRNSGNMAAIWLLNIASMTLGEYPDGVPQAWRIPPSAFASKGDVGRFADVARERGAAFFGLAGGVCLEDFDADGDLDLFHGDWALDSQVHYLVNDGTGHFTDHTDGTGLAGITGGLNLIHADYDNDGLPDVLVLRGAWRKEAGCLPNSLLRNLGGGSFADVTEAAGVLSFHPTQTAAWLDYDGDGWLDLFIGNETMPGGAGPLHPCELFHNDGDGTFTECAADAGVAVLAYVKGVVAGDYDDDGRPDLYLSRQDGDEQLLRNEGPRDAAPLPAGEHAPGARAPAAALRPWRFTDVAGKAGVPGTTWTFPCWFFDYDNDGHLDIFVSGYKQGSVRKVAREAMGEPPADELPHLYRNRGDGSFEDATVRLGVNTLVLTMGCNFGDLDEDGWPDFYLGTGEPDYMALYPNRMFRNDGGQRFLDVTTSGGFGHLQKGHAIAFGDIDGDGDQDVFAVMGGAYSGDGFQSALFLNPGHGRHGLTLRLRGTTANRCAIGAKVRVHVLQPDGSERDVYADVGTGGSFGSQSLQAEIGLGDATAVQWIEVRWPAPGKLQRYPGVALDRVHELVEGAAEAVPVPTRIR
jgi:FG-GAP-like repeat/ASPIC and UnbV